MLLGVIHLAEKIWQHVTVAFNQLVKIKVYLHIGDRLNSWARCCFNSLHRCPGHRWDMDLRIP
jgi:hypothetical protein